VKVARTNAIQWQIYFVTIHVPEGDVIYFGALYCEVSGSNLEGSRREDSFYASIGVPSVRDVPKNEWGVCWFSRVELFPVRWSAWMPEVFFIYC
jgi:hypothetical protein